MKNTGDPWTSWTLKFAFANGQTVTQGWGGTWSQSGANVTVSNVSYNGSSRLRRVHHGPRLHRQLGQRQRGADGVLRQRHHVRR
ncbi:cellulose binding domain-containing protein [Luedemannella flava]